MKLNLVADDDWAVDGGAYEGLHEDVKVGLSWGGGVADRDSHVVQTREVLQRNCGDVKIDPVCHISPP